MRYRTLDADSDMTFGQGGLNFLVNSREAVGQAILTRLRLEVGEWFLDVTEGTPYLTQVFGYGTAKSRDVAIRSRIVETPGVLEITEYSSSADSDRRLRVSASVSTIYGSLGIEIGAGYDPNAKAQLDWSIAGNVILMVVT